MRSKIRNGVGRRALLLISMQVGRQRRQHSHGSLNTHTQVQGAAALPKPNPRPELAQAEGFFGLRDRRPTDAGEDEFVPDFVEFGELVVFPRSLTS